MQLKFENLLDIRIPAGELDLTILSKARNKQSFLHFILWLNLELES